MNRLKPASELALQRFVIEEIDAKFFLISCCGSPKLVCTIICRIATTCCWLGRPSLLADHGIRSQSNALDCTIELPTAAVHRVHAAQATNVVVARCACLAQASAQAPGGAVGRAVHDGAEVVTVGNGVGARAAAEVAGVVA